MNKLFAKKDGSIRLPLTLTNLSLVGNKVRKHRVVRKQDLTPTTNKSDLVIASYPLHHKKETMTIPIATAMMKYNLFANLKFRSKHKVALHTAQYMVAHRYVVATRGKMLKSLALGMGYDSPRLLHEHLHDKIEEGEDLTDNENKFIAYHDINLPYSSEAHVKNMCHKAVDKLILGASLSEVMEFIVPHAPFYMGRDRVETYNYAISALRIHYPPNVHIPDEYAQKDAQQLTDTVMKLFTICEQAKQYTRGMDLTTNYKWITDEGRWRGSPLSNPQLRRRVNKAVRILTLQDLDYYDSSMFAKYGFASEIRGEPDMEVPITLASNDYLEALMQQGLDDDDERDVLSLPDNISPKLAQQIEEQAEAYHERNLIDYTTNENGVHGIAKVKPFVPNHRIQKAIREITRRSSDRGVVPKKMYRLTTDRKVFNVKANTLGGSLMIDFSGSMSWNESDVREVIDILPAANIAGYTGYGYKIDDCDGMIGVIAKDGKLDTNAISNLYEHGYNSVDLDALKWLASMPEPRIWISDQQVVGVNSNGGSANLPLHLRTEIASFMIKNNIIPIKAKELVKELARQLAR